jgi:hypothetical protein
MRRTPGRPEAGGRGMSPLPAAPFAGRQMTVTAIS